MSFAPKLGATVNVGVDTQSSSVSLDSIPNGDFEMRVFNSGDAVSFVNFGSSGVAANTADDIPMPPKSVEVFALSSTALTPITHAAAITAAGSSTVYFTPSHSEAQYDYLVTNDGDATTANSFAGVLALGAATLSGKTVGVQPLGGTGFYSKKTFTLAAAAQPITFVATGSGVRIDRIQFLNNAADIIIDGVSILSYESPMVDPVIAQNSSTGAITIRNSPRISGNLDGDPFFPFDPNSNLYKEMGSVFAEIDPVTGAIIGGEVVNPYIGDNWTGAKTDPLNGTITFQIVSGSGTGASGITIDVVDGDLQQNTLTIANGGSGYANNTNERATVLKIPGAVRFSDVMQYAFQASGAANFAHGRVIFLNNYITFARRGVVGHENMHIEGNHFDALMGDQCQIGGANTALFGANTVILWNLFSRAYARGTDYGNPHVDFIQLSANNNRLADWPIHIEGNIIVNGVSRSAGQGIFLSDMQPGYGYVGRVCNNTVAVDEAINCISVEEAKDIIVFGNTICRWNVANPANTSPASLRISGSAYGTVIFCGNITENIAGIPSRVVTDKVANVILVQNSATDYAAKLSDSQSKPTTRAAAEAAFTSLGVAENAGMFRAGSPVDLANRTVDVTDEPVAAVFDNLLDAPVNTTVYSTPARIVGGPATGPFAMTGSGFEIQFADDVAFTQNVTSPATSGTYTRGKFARCRFLTGASGTTTASASISFNDLSYAWSVSTASVLQYVSLDNGGAAWSKLAAFTTGTHNKLLLSAEVRYDALATGPFAGRTTSNDYLGMTTGNIMQLLLGGGSNLNLRTANAMGTGWVRIIIVVDMPAGVATVLWNTVQQTLAVATVNTSGSLNLASLFSGGWGLFSNNTGSTIANGAVRYLYWHSWSGNTHQLPDVSTQTARDALFNAFSADLIDLADGSGPLGAQPLGFWTATDLTEANSVGGIPNRGSVASAPFVKQAGTYA